MPQGLRRFHNTGQRHFITSSCYRCQPFPGSARRRDYFLKIFEEVRQKYDLVVWGYVVMPEHFHILNKRAGERKCRPRDAGVETTWVERLP
jgi:putative transposase